MRDKIAKEKKCWERCVGMGVRTGHSPGATSDWTWCFTVSFCGDLYLLSVHLTTKSRELDVHWLWKNTSLFFLLSKNSLNRSPKANAMAQTCRDCPRLNPSLLSFVGLWASACLPGNMSHQDRQKAAGEKLYAYSSYQEGENFPRIHAPLAEIYLGLNGQNMKTCRLKGQQKTILSWSTLTKFDPTPGPDKYVGLP